MQSKHILDIGSTNVYDGDIGMKNGTLMFRKLSTSM